MAKKLSPITLEFILLGLIKDEPAHGYALFERLHSSPELSLIWQVKRSKLYYLLDKLERDGFLASSPQKEGSFPERNVYRITEPGDRALAEWLSTPVLSSRYIRLAFLSKLYFAARTSREEVQELISLQKQVCLGWLDSLEAQRRQLDRNQYLTSQIYLFRIGQIQAMLAWLDSCWDNLPT